MSILALTSNTLAGSPGAGQIEYNGQFFATDSNSARGQLERVTLSTAIASTSGTSITFTGIPAWAKRVTVMFSNVSTNGTSVVQVQLGSGSATTTGYVVANQAGTSTTNPTTGFPTYGAAASDARSGTLTFTNITGNTWVGSGISGNTGGSGVSIQGGYIALAGTLDRVIITTVNGTDTFDAGSINIMYEG